MAIKGRIHSIQTLGTLDGPGLRTVVFFQGCVLHCNFCHNVDMSPRTGGVEYTPQELAAKVIKNKSYWGTYDDTKPANTAAGGVTMSGGEPTTQYEFAREFAKELKLQSVHVAIDTCFGTAPQIISSLIPYVDYWMISIKHMDDSKHLALTDTHNETILKNILLLDALLDDYPQKQIRVRFVVIPGVTDDPAHIVQLGEFVSKLKHLDVIELLPYGTHGKFKWIEIYGNYPLDGIREATRDDVEQVAKILEQNFELKTKY